MPMNYLQSRHLLNGSGLPAQLARQVFNTTAVCEESVDAIMGGTDQAHLGGTLCVPTNASSAAQLPLGKVQPATHHAFVLNTLRTYQRALTLPASRSSALASGSLAFAAVVRLLASILHLATVVAAGTIADGSVLVAHAVWHHIYGQWCVCNF